MPEPIPYTAALRRAAGDLIRTPIPEDAMVDVAGEVAAVIRDLQALNKTLKAEMAPEATGESYKATTSRSAARSYNTQGILAAAGEALGADLTDTLRTLMAEDAVRLTWRWTELQAAAIEYDFPMTIVRHEIKDGDPVAMVGEVWTEATTVGGRTE